MFDDPRTLIAGDWHGSYQWALMVFELAHKQGIKTLYHVGDFGVWPGAGGFMYRQTLDSWLRSHDSYLIVTLGNHEDYDQVETWPTNDEGFIVEPKRPHIWYCPRGFVWEHAGARMGSLGGAFSIDKYLRGYRTEWWPQEEITWDDVKAMQTNMKYRGWEALDIVLTHDIPAGLPVGTKQFNLPPELEFESYRQRSILRDGIDLVMPHSVVHGHWHKVLDNVLEGVGPHGIDYEAQVLGLSNEYQAGNFIIADILPGIGLNNVTWSEGRHHPTWNR